MKAVEEMLVNKKVCPLCNSPLTVKRSKFGMFLGCSRYPDCTYKDSIVDENLAGDKTCPNCKVPLTVKKGRYGTFLACPNYPECKHTERIRGNANNSRNRFKKRPGGKTIQG